MITRREDAIGLEAAAWDMAEEWFGAPPTVLKRITVPQERAPDRDEFMAIRGVDVFTVSVDEVKRRTEKAAPPDITPEGLQKLMGVLKVMYRDPGPRWIDIADPPSGFSIYLKSQDMLQKCPRCGRIQPVNRQWCQCRRLKQY